MLTIGFAYSARSGKDTAINYIIKKYGIEYSIEKHSFADSLKREVCGKEKELCEKFNIEYDNNPPMDDPLCNSIHGKQRPLLQWYGTEYRRKQDGDYWIKQLDNHIKNLKTNPKVVLISDCRFRNEIDYIKNNNGIVIHVTRPNFESELTEEQKNHASEIELQNYTGFDYTLVNDCSLQEYKQKSCNLFLEIYNKIYGK